MASSSLVLLSVLGAVSSINKKARVIRTLDPPPLWNHDIGLQALRQSSTFNILHSPSADQPNRRASRPHHHLLLATQWWGGGIPMVEIQQVSSAERLATGDLHTAEPGVRLHYPALQSTCS